SGWPSDTDSDVKMLYSLMVLVLGKLLKLNLKSVAQSQIEADATVQSRLLSPAGEVALVEAQPQVTAGVLNPALIMSAQLGEDQAAAGPEPVGEALERLRWRRHVVQHHIAHHGVRRGQGLGLQGIGQQAFDIDQTGLAALLAGALQHGWGVVQGQHPGEAAGQI